MRINEEDLGRDPVDAMAGLYLMCDLPADLQGVCTAACVPRLEFMLQAVRAAGAVPVRGAVKDEHLVAGCPQRGRGFPSLLLASKALDIAAWEPFLVEGCVRMSATVRAGSPYRPGFLFLE